MESFPPFPFVLNTTLVVGDGSDLLDLITVGTGNPMNRHHAFPASSFFTYGWHRLNDDSNKK